MQHETMEFDVLIVGAGPAGLSCAIQYAKSCQNNSKKIKICILEKGAEIGAHILSGAAIDPKALNELIPNWQQLNLTKFTKAVKDEFYLLSEKGQQRLPVPHPMKNDGNYIVSLGQLCRGLGNYAQQLGIDIYPGFAASSLLYENDRVIGVATNELGINKAGEKKATYQPSIHLLAKQIVLAEGCRGSLSEQVIKKYDLRKYCQNQTYAIGLKEIWQIDPNQHRSGTVMHTIGWPLDPKTYGGTFVYHWDDNLLSIGLAIGLDYKNPYLNPYLEFQRFKKHPLIQPLLENGQCLSYGARALNEGGWQSIPKLSFPGGVLIGCGAGFLNVPKIKGTHTAMKSGMIAAELIFTNIHKANPASEITEFSHTVKKSWVGKELKKVRNIRPSFHWGLLPGLFYSALDTYILHGHAPWTFRHNLDHGVTQLAKNYKPIMYDKPDGKYTFDKMTSVARTDVYHEENQPCHLKIKDAKIPVEKNYTLYAGLEEKYCPAGVYEFVKQDNAMHLQINATNCIHCKTCDIKDPHQNIVWTTPEGGNGPNYRNM